MSKPPTPSKFGSWYAEAQNRVALNRPFYRVSHEMLAGLVEEMTTVAKLVQKDERRMGCVCGEAVDDVMIFCPVHGIAGRDHDVKPENN